MRNYQDLVAWQKAMDLVAEVYRVSGMFPQEERFGLVSQVRRAAVSIPSNIAEGEGRNSRKEFARALAIAHGSLREIETQLLIACRLDYIDQKEIECLTEKTCEVGRLINGLWNSLLRE